MVFQSSILLHVLSYFLFIYYESEVWEPQGYSFVYIYSDAFKNLSSKASKFLLAGLSKATALSGVVAKGLFSLVKSFFKKYNRDPNSVLIKGGFQTPKF